MTMQIMPAEVQFENWASICENALKTLKDIQSMIDITSERLVALRDLRPQEFIKKEIRSLEGKLVKQFCRQLATKCQIPEDHWPDEFQKYPSLSRFLTVVGVCKRVKETLSSKMISIESLLNRNEDEILNILHECGGDSEDERKLLTALGQLRGFEENQVEEHHDSSEVYWDSWTKTARHQEQNGDVIDSSDHECIVQSETDVDFNENIQRVHQGATKSPGYSAKSTHRILVNTSSGRVAAPVCSDGRDHAESNHNMPSSPSYSSRSSLSSTGQPSPPGCSPRNLGIQHYFTSTHPMNASTAQTGNVGHHSSGSVTRFGQSSLTNTPSPMCPHKSLEPKLHGCASCKSSAMSGNRNLLPPFGQMRGARSYEWQVGGHIAPATDENLTNSNLSLTSVSTLPPPSTASSSSGQKLFSARKKHKKRPENIVINRCEPPDFIDILRPSVRRTSQTMTGSDNGLSTSTTGSPVSPRTPMTPGTPINSELLLQYREFSHSPVILHTPKTPGKFKGLRAIRDKIKDKMGIRSKLRRNKSEERVADDAIDAHSHHKARSDTFPNINVDGMLSGGHHMSTDGKLYHGGDSFPSFEHSAASISSSQLLRMQNDVNFLSSGMTTPGEASLLVGRDNFGFDMNSHFDELNIAGTDKTLVPEDVEAAVESDDHFLDSDMNADDLIEKLENTTHQMRANLMRQTSTTSTMHEEWDVPWDELVFQERIGQGRVGAVYKGKWHGEVAIRVINICHYDESKLRAFKHEVMLYKKTRHDNVELFMGSCMNPPRLAIITGYCKGKSLYHFIRTNKEQVNINQAKIIAQHVAQGMGYLHSRGIIHKDLKSKNIFIDGRRVTVTDFGLMGLHAISKKSLLVKPMALQIPDGWLCYMAPEVIRALRVPIENYDVVSSLPYTKESDMYAFGTVWYELLAGCWPFKDYPPESIVWQVGHGKKQSLAHLQGAKELKDILMACWAYDAGQRPDFTDSGIMGQLLRLPQAKIIRRSSQPIKGNKKTGRQGGIGGHERLFDPLSFQSVLHEHAE